MKKIIIGVIALSAFSGAALAAGNRNNELHESDTYFGKYSESTAISSSTASDLDANAIAVSGTVASEGEWLFGRLGITRDPAEIRRWDEKNN